MVLCRVSDCTLLALSPTGWGSVMSSPRRGRSGPRYLHDRDKVLVEAALVLAGGGESSADIGHLRTEAALFGFVPPYQDVLSKLGRAGDENRTRVLSLGRAVRRTRTDQGD